MSTQAARSMSAHDDHESCCSRIADVICNRQAHFIEKLREIRPVIEQCHVTILCFKSDLERRRVTADDLSQALQHIRLACDALTTVLGNNRLNITSAERLVMRQIKEEMAVLSNHIEDADAEELTKVTSQLDRLLIGMVASTGENLREYMRWTDEKTERRWWLTETIRFLQVFVKLALFVSAAISVIYHEEQTAPIVTLAITILQGVVELMDQFFVREIAPKQIKLSLISLDRPSTA